MWVPETRFTSAGEVAQRVGAKTLHTSCDLLILAE